MNEENKKNGELIDYSYTLKEGNYVKKIYYEFETEKAVKFGRNEDEKMLWIPKSVIKGGWKKDKKFPQNIRIKNPIPLSWEENKKRYL
ncbi:MAG: hypothetical protein ACFFD2_14790 [Promethearchaeota archaeon]